MPPTAPPDVASPVTLDCSEYIDRLDLDSIPDDYEEVAGVLALPTADSSNMALQISRHGSGDDSIYFAKTGLEEIQ